MIIVHTGIFENASEGVIGDIYTYGMSECGVDPSYRSILTKGKVLII